MRLDLSSFSRLLPTVDRTVAANNIIELFRTAQLLERKPLIANSIASDACGCKSVLNHASSNTIFNTFSECTRLRQSFALLFNIAASNKRRIAFFIESTLVALGSDLKMDENAVAKPVLRRKKNCCVFFLLFLLVFPLPPPSTRCNKLSNHMYGKLCTFFFLLLLLLSLLLLLRIFFVCFVFFVIT